MTSRVFTRLVLWDFHWRWCLSWSPIKTILIFWLYLTFVVMLFCQYRFAFNVIYPGNNLIRIWWITELLIVDCPCYRNINLVEITYTLSLYFSFSNTQIQINNTYLHSVNFLFEPHILNCITYSTTRTYTRFIGPCPRLNTAPIVLWTGWHAPLLFVFVTMVCFQVSI